MDFVSFSSGLKSYPGRNSVHEAIAGGRDMEKIIFQKNAGGGIKDILSMARERKIPVRYEKKENGLSGSFFMLYP